MTGLVLLLLTDRGVDCSILFLPGAKVFGVPEGEPS